MKFSHKVGGQEWLIVHTVYSYTGSQSIVPRSAIPASFGNLLEMQIPSSQLRFTVHRAQQFIFLTSPLGISGTHLRFEKHWWREDFTLFNSGHLRGWGKEAWEMYVSILLFLKLQPRNGMNFRELRMIPRAQGSLTHAPICNSVWWPSLSLAYTNWGCHQTGREFGTAL